MTAKKSIRTTARILCQMACRVSAVFFLGIVPCYSQLPTATILGVVKDTSAAVVPDATVTARNVDTGLTRTAATGGDGGYRLSALPVGNYEIRVEHPGFQTEVRSGMTLTVSQEAVVNVTLLVGAVEQTVAVTAEAPLVNTTSGSLGGLVNEQKVADLPLNGRNYIDLTLLQTGVTENKVIGKGVLTGTIYSSNGAPMRSNNYLLDGANLVTLMGGSSASLTGTTLGVEGIREYRVITNAFSAEYGMTMGSQMIIVSKSGTNSFHGSAFEYLRNSALDARNFFDLKTPTTPRRLPQFARNNFGAAFGGPIKKDRTFFFAVYEGLRERLGLTVVDNVIPPSAKVDGGLVPQIAPVIKPLLALYPDPNLPGNQYTFAPTQPSTENYGQVRGDHTFSSNDTMFVRHTIDDGTRTRPLAYPQFQDISTGRSQFITLSESHVFSPTLLNTFRYSLSRSITDIESPSGLIGPQYSFVPGLEMGIIGISGVTSLGPNGNAPQFRKQNIFTWSDDLFYTRGRHSLKFGTLINRYQQYIQSDPSLTGSVSFPNLTAFLQARPQTYSALTPGSKLDRTFHYSTYGFYLQDDLRARSNLTLNLGLRYEFLTVPVEVHNEWSALRDIQHDAVTTLGPPFQNPSLKNISPRFGFAWDVAGNGKMAVRGGFALLYDIGNIAILFVQNIPNDPPYSSGSQVTNPPGFSLPLFFPPEAVGKALRPIDYLVQQPHLLSYNLTLERQLPFQMALTLAYAGSRGINLYQNTEGNPTIPQVLPDGRRFWPANAPRTNPYWGTLDFYTAGSSSTYNSMQLELKKRLSRGWEFQSSYTWSAIMDTPQGQANSEPSNAGSSKPQDASQLSLDRARSNFDVPQNWRFNTTYHLPDTGLAGAAGKILNGWWLSGILSLQSGYPFTPGLGSNRSRSLTGGGGSGVDRPDVVPDRSYDSIILGGPNKYFDPTAFAIQPAGFLGNLGRNTLRGPGFSTLDFSVVKDTELALLGEGSKLQFRAEMFNILNHANFFMPNRIVYSGVQNVEAPLTPAGSITSTISSSRQVQFALKILF